MHTNHPTYIGPGEDDKHKRRELLVTFKAYDG